MKLAKIEKLLVEAAKESGIMLSSRITKEYLEETYAHLQDKRRLPVREREMLSLFLDEEEAAGYVAGSHVDIARRYQTEGYCLDYALGFIEGGLREIEEGNYEELIGISSNRLPEGIEFEVDEKGQIRVLLDTSRDPGKTGIDDGMTRVYTKISYLDGKQFEEGKVREAVKEMLSLFE